jgi:hypothetical protein
MTYTIFGCNNPSGAYFRDLASISSVEIWGRTKPIDGNSKYVYCDLKAEPEYPIHNIRGVLVSFAPIWLLSEYLSKVSVEQPESLKDLKGVIAVSSSSYLTKQFAFSHYDKNLARSLSEAHATIIHVCQSLKIHCQILAPTLVYGLKDGFKDRNISQIIKIMRFFPFVFLPKSTGLRQPIHASQLAQVAHNMAERILEGTWQNGNPLILTLGGDEIMSYSHMLTKIQRSLPINDAGRRCRLIEIPDRVFLIFFALLLPINTKLFEAIMRINSDLAGFSKANNLLAEKPKDFPVLPLSL